LAFAATACGLAAAAHTSAGGDPAWWVTVLGVVLTARLIWPATRRRMGAARLITTTVGVQWVMHLVYELTAQPAPQQPMVDHGSGMVMAAPVGHSASAITSPGTFLLGWGNGPMLMAHLGVAAAFGVWLAVLERQVWSLAARMGRRLVGSVAAQVRVWLALFTPVVPVPVLATAAVRTRRRRHRQRPPRLPVPVSAVARRGPPGVGAIVCR